MCLKRIAAGSTTIWLGLILCNTAYESMARTAEGSNASMPPSIESIRELVELTVLEIAGTEVVTRSINGHTGCTTAIVVVTGSVTLAVDLKQARIIEADQDHRHLVLSLPQPSVRRVAIDHDASRVASCQRSGLWQMAVGQAHEDRVVAEAFTAGQQRIVAAVGEERYAQLARDHTESVLHRFADEVGWTIEVQWEE